MTNYTAHLLPSLKRQPSIVHTRSAALAPTLRESAPPVFPLQYGPVVLVHDQIVNLIQLHLFNDLFTQLPMLLGAFLQVTEFIQVACDLIASLIIFIQSRGPFSYQMVALAKFFDKVRKLNFTRVSHGGRFHFKLSTS